MVDANAIQNFTQKTTNLNAFCCHEWLTQLKFEALN